jgi:serine/threonine-protein kinase RsbW
MASERAPPGRPPGAIRRSIAADPVAVRDALEAISAGLSARGVSPERCATAELVLAEVLNNIVEHAYAGGPGRIHVAILALPDVLHYRVRDGGRPMPGGALPPGCLPPGAQPDADTEDLPEGGFGWFLIRELSRSLQYSRHGDHNQLSFLVPLSPDAQR